MREILRFIAPALRGAGFRGSGQNYRKAEGDFIFIINFQGSRWGSDFYVNLAAQPTFVPPLHDAPLARLKEYECFLRRRVGTSWPWDMSAGQAASFQAELLDAQRDFFAHAQTLRSALAVGQAEVLVATFSAGTTRALAAAQLARAALALGHPEGTAVGEPWSRAGGSEGLASPRGDAAHQERALSRPDERPLFRRCHLGNPPTPTATG